MASPNINAFKPLPIKGDTTLPRTGMVITARTKSDELIPLIPGQAVKIVDSEGGVPEMTALTASTDAAFGVVLYNIKNVNFPANEAFELGMRNTVVYMEASAAIARGAYVTFNYLTNKVSTALLQAPVLGIALDKATADGDLIRVILDVPSTESATA